MKSTEPGWLQPFQSKSFVFGLFLVLLSGLLFGLHESWEGYTGPGNTSPGLFVFHYLLAGGYGLYLLIAGYLVGRRRKAGRPLRMLLWIQFLISCFALNREMAVFQESVPWVSAAVVGAAALLIVSFWLDWLTVRAQQLVLIGLGAAWWLFFYQTLYLLPLFPISMIGLLALGLSVHTYIPLLLTLELTALLHRCWNAHEHRRPAILLGWVLPLFVMFYFVYQWNRANATIRKTLDEIQVRRDAELPDWALMAQRLRPDWATSRLLQTGTTYDQLRFADRIVPLETRRDQVRRHDPLVVIAASLVPPVAFSEPEQVKLLNTLYDERHSLEEKLWSGRNLKTGHVLTQVKLFPEYRLAYTEKLIQVQSTQPNGLPQEALYTFHLPEGSVATSLSLWINGVEEKAALTTQAKADTAYRTVVGFERRDPSLLKWQEGNRLTVRVFPVQSGEMRQVRVGITTPLRPCGDRLVYENPWFEGPNGKSATETVRIEFSQPPADLQLPTFLQPGLVSEAGSRNLVTSHANYRPLWKISLKAPAVAASSFHVAGKSYRMEPLQPVAEAFSPGAIYLDVNETWSEEEVSAIRKAAGPCPVWVYDDQLERLTDDNQQALLEKLRRLRFSLFPVYRIPDPATALLVTKADDSGPFLDELAESAFAQKLKSSADRTPLRTFSLSDEPSAVVRTLTELRLLKTSYGTAEALAENLRRHQFTTFPEVAGAVNLPTAGVRIREAAEQPSGPAAPDHLYRLYAYNHLMQQIGAKYFDRTYLADSLIQEAQRANVVSPLSSLIVLEKASDYERFGIKRRTGGLGNATHKNEGAVPEPHEWALLALALVWVWYTIRQRRYARS
ncbi:XrtN system VIT domain-containing protein [Tellurirhabdus rosea]|uniref:XrtN system VIT domain-containing protein n=1 Tax=Tellurirhabdus rosea TaxID=2674997 RepID=UPI002255A7C1|nr:XrtN system VIT domain-containing protein [Tellurirhabdus rosea]